MMEPTSNQPSTSTRLVALFLATIAMARAVSYLFRPPPVGSPTDNTIFQIMPPQAWVVVLVVMAVLLLVGAIGRKLIPLFLGSMMGVLVYTTFGYNLVPPVLRDSTKGWQGIGELLFVAAVHGLLVRALGPHFRSKVENEGGR